ncbi:MAG: hypothetical protein RBU37_02250 [Myxococcota bacterium]|nr:hypothetical protein [Myxococcota bacterium]
MNILLISPHYPQRLYHFAMAFKARGFNLVGIGDTPYHQLNDELKASLSDYVQHDLSCYASSGVIDPARYEPLYRTVAYLVSKHGRFDAIESLNEYWLPLEAQLRLDFNTPGPKPEELAHLVRKSLMKAHFQEAGALVVPGEVLLDQAQLERFFATHQDIVVKPDVGVGASDTRRLRTAAEVDQFWREKNPNVTYFIEKFVHAEDRELISFDGIADKDGELVFFCEHSYCAGIMEVVGGMPLTYFNYKNAEIPPKLMELGIATVKSFGLRKRFFHIEYFRIGDDYYGLEINARPPGVLTLDLMNHAKAIDVWALFAAVMGGEKPKPQFGRDWTCAYNGRLERLPYRHQHHEIMATYGEFIGHFMPMDSPVMGDFAYVVVAPSHEKRREVMDFINALHD